LNLTDSLVRIYGKLAILSQSFSIADLISVLSSNLRGLSQALRLIDILSRIYSSFKTLTQILNITDNLFKSYGTLKNLTQIISFSSTRTYNFSDATNNKAYNSSIADEPPTSLTPLGETEFSSGAYTNISSSNNEYFTSEHSSLHPYHRFNITINEDLNKIEQITVKWKGHSGSNGTVNLYVYNFTSSSWMFLNNGSGLTDFNLVYTFTSDFSDIIDNNKVFVLVQDPPELIK